jgi:CDP-paratose 2-epimerase
MGVAIVTRSAGLIGSEPVRFFAEQGLDVVGIDSGMRRTFFGEEASADWSFQVLEDNVLTYTHNDFDIQD